MGKRGGDGPAAGNRGRDSRPEKVLTKVDGSPKPVAVAKTHLEEFKAAASENGWTQKDVFNGNKVWTTSVWEKGADSVIVMTNAETGKIRSADLRRSRPDISEFAKDTLDMVGTADRDKRKRTRNYFKNFGGK